MARVAPRRAVATAPFRPARAAVLTAAVFLLLAAAGARPARAAWVESDYPSSVACGATIPAELCDPADAAANSACRDMCHYGGRRGGRCVGPGPQGLVRGCLCRC